MTDVEAVVQRYYGDRSVIQRIDDALRAEGIDPERPSHSDLWPFDQLHSRGIVATREHAERARGLNIKMPDAKELLSKRVGRVIELTEARWTIACVRPVGQ